MLLAFSFCLSSFAQERTIDNQNNLDSYEFRLSDIEVRREMRKIEITLPNGEVKKVRYNLRLDESLSGLQTNTSQSDQSIEILESFESQSNKSRAQAGVVSN